MLDENPTSSPSAGQQTTMTTAAAAPTTTTPSRVRLNDQQLESVTREELLAHWKQQDAYIDTLLAQTTSHEGRKLLWFRSMNDCFSLHGIVTVLFNLKSDSVVKSSFLTELSGFTETLICVETLYLIFYMVSSLILMCMRHLLILINSKTETKNSYILLFNTVVYDAISQKQSTTL